MGQGGGGTLCQERLVNQEKPPANIDRSSKTNVAPLRYNFWHPITGIHAVSHKNFEYQEIRQLLITIKAAAFQLHNLASAPKPSTIYINQVVKCPEKDASTTYVPNI